MPTAPESIRDIARRNGASYARDSWSNVDTAAAWWLRSGSSSAVACSVDPMAAESAFIAGFMAERARRRREP